MHSTSFPGSSPSRPPERARERETLENAGHVSPRKKNSPDGVPVFGRFVPQIFVNIIWILRSAMFYSSLHFAIVNSSYWNINLKPKQVQFLEAIYFGRDTIGVLPTGYEKSIIFHLLPGLFLDKINSRSTCQTDSPIHPVIVVVSPLNSLISDQIRRSTEGNVKAAILNVRKAKDSDDLDLDNTSETNSSWLKDGKYDIIFTHPEVALSCKNSLSLQGTGRRGPWGRGCLAFCLK